MKVLFICTGNMCRSPAAELLLRHYGAAGFEARSRGTGVQPNFGLHKKMAALLKADGVTALAHKGSLVMEPDIDWADLILVMEEGHRDALADQFPQSMRKTQLLLDYAGPGGDLEDPMGKDDKVFAQVFETIKAAVLKLIEKQH